MKSLGVTQFLSKKFKFLPVDEKWKGILGSLPSAFVGIVYGGPGNGKTEFLVQLAKDLCAFGRVAWVSYEQGHGPDLQKALIRNNMQEVAGQFVPLDPNEKREEGLSLFEELKKLMSRRNSPQFYIIDSYDYLKLTEDEYHELKHRFGRKKGIIFVSHAEGNKPKRAVAVHIEHDGHFGIFVKKFIAYPAKNRFGGFDPYIIWEEEARKRNPLFFKERDRCE